MVICVPGDRADPRRASRRRTTAAAESPARARMRHTLIATTHATGCHAHTVAHYFSDEWTTRSRNSALNSQKGCPPPPPVVHSPLNDFGHSRWLTNEWRVESDEAAITQNKTHAHKTKQNAKYPTSTENKTKCCSDQSSLGDGLAEILLTKYSDLQKHSPLDSTND